MKPRCEICRKPAGAGQLVIPVLTYTALDRLIETSETNPKFVHLTCVETTRRS